MKSFFSVMYNPSNVKVSMMNASNPRIHHVVKWANTTPMIISDDYKKVIIPKYKTFVQLSLF
jgi:hypothetical protein